MRKIVLITAISALIACGDDGETAPSAPPAPATPSATGAPTTETTQAEATSEQPSSVETPAPEPAVGCPANDVTAQLDRAGTIHHADIQSDETLDLAGSPHRFRSGVTIHEGATLTVAPCALVLIGAGRRVHVGNGAALVAEGAEGQPARFDSEAPDPSPGQWHGIQMQATARPQTRLVHTIIEDAGGSHLGAAVYADGEFALKVQNLTIRHCSQHGVVLRNEARFTDDSTALTVTECGREDPYSAPVWFESASQVRTLPDGEYTGNAYDEIWVDSAHVRTTGTWRNPGVRYRLSEGITVAHQTGPVLTIAPGTTLAFNPQKPIAVGFGGDGGLVLDGESEETPILLTSARPLPAPGDWAGVRLGGDRADAVTKLNYVVIEHAGSSTSHQYGTQERESCRTSAEAAIAIRDRDLGPRITNVTIRSLPENAGGVLLGFRGEATDYTLEEHGNDFTSAGTGCHQNLQPEGDCPEPACRAAQ